MEHKDGSFRLKNWDYSNKGIYFLTICTRNKEHFFGKVEKDKAILNRIGAIAESNWCNIELQFPNIEIADYVIMPNHLHVRLIIDGINRVKTNDERRAINREPTGGITGNKNPMLHKNISTAVRWFKGKTTFDCRKIDVNFGWHSKFYDHIIRNQKSFLKIQDYIQNNPRLWYRDRNNETGVKM